ncbi:MAG: hypothetical protein C0622_02970 [Desulfuromonas sp.]|nr:MAG: hypothetical protein C0622_02970 [Desulfuromonas sp.]
MTDTTCSESLPKMGLLALAISLSAYISCQAGLLAKPTCLIVFILIVSGSVQIVSALRYQNQGRTRAAGTFLPLGIFWLSIIGYQIFPRLGIGRFPSSVAIFSYLSLWALFVAILFLASFHQNVAILSLYGSMMMSFMALAADQLRHDGIFLIIGCTCGFVAAFFAFYICLAQFLEERTRRKVLPLGKCLCRPE